MQPIFVFIYNWLFLVVPCKVDKNKKPHNKHVVMGQMRYKITDLDYLPLVGLAVAALAVRFAVALRLQVAQFVEHPLEELE